MARPGAQLAVALDAQTGVVVVLEPVGGGSRDGLTFTVDLHAFDHDLDAVFAGRGAG
jgi:hypothetical protein